METWKNIDGFENYQVSNYGNVRNFKCNSLRTPCILKLSTNTKGYIRITLYGIIRQHAQVHRLVATAFIPNPENKKEVNHINGIKTDNRVENLEWNTPKENVRHAWDNKLNHALKGDENGRSKLTKKEVLEIRASHLNGVVLSTIYNVSCAHISRVRLNQTWSHI